MLNFCFADDFPAFPVSTSVIEKRLHLLLEGHVQGVGFRYTTCDLGLKFCVKGFVRNLPDGNVEIVAEGDERVLGDFWAALRRNSVYRHVTRANITWAAAEGRAKDFTISYV